MLKFLPLAKPRDGLTPAQSQDHLRYHHSRLCALDPEFNRHEPKYVQNFIFSDGVGPDRVLATEYSSVAENIFHGPDGFADAYGEPSYANMREDEVKFATFDDLLLVGTTPSPIFGNSLQDTAFKVWRFACLGDGADAEQARRVWQTTFATAMAGDQRVRQTVDSYIQDRPFPLETNFPETKTADLVDEYWIRSLDMLPEFLEAERELREQSGIDAYLDLETEIRFVSETKVVWDLGEDPLAALPRTRRWHQQDPQEES